MMRHTLNKLKKLLGKLILTWAIASALYYATPNLINIFNFAITTSKYLRSAIILVGVGITILFIIQDYEEIKDFINN